MEGVYLLEFNYELETKKSSERNYSMLNVAALLLQLKCWDAGWWMRAPWWAPANLK